MIQLCNGLKNSLIVLELLRDNEELNKLNINVKCFQNLREMGLTFTTNDMTYCVYEHRNSDSIIINGKKNWSSKSDDLPYKGDKWDTIAEFSYANYEECAKCLSKLLLKMKRDNNNDK